jgi:hypothetical protein
MVDTMRICKACRMVLIYIIIAMTMSAISAVAASPVGYWTGSFSGAGHSSGASASFSSGGGVTLSAMGISASGSYGGGSIRVSSHGYSITLHYSVRGDSMTISGGKYGLHGSMSLSRVGVVDRSEELSDGADSPEVKELKKALSGQWTVDADGTRYDVNFYSAGFLSWVETPLSDGAGESIEYGARFEVSDGKLTLKPLDEAVEMPLPPLWPETKEGSMKSWEFSYEVKGSALKLSIGDEEVLTLSHVKETDATPPEALFRPYITFKRGNRGEVVRQMQEALIAAGHLVGEADGVFGAMTEKAVKAFQKANGLEADGVAAREVLTALYR